MNKIVRAQYYANEVCNVVQLIAALVASFIAVVIGVLVGLTEKTKDRRINFRHKPFQCHSAGTAINFRAFREH